VQTPSDVRELTGLYLIDRLRNLGLWYLWTFENGEWVILKTGDWEAIVKKLEALEEE